MTDVQPRNVDWEPRVRTAFASQGFMDLLAASLDVVRPGRISIRAARRPSLCQQHGFVHAGVLATLCDTAAGFAALTLADADADVLTAEFKINLLRPANGDRIRAAAAVVKAGRLLTVCTAEATVDDTVCALATVTLANPMHS